MSRPTYDRPFFVEGHDPDCAANYLEPCDCVSGIVRTIKLAFAAQLKTISETPHHEP